MSLAEVINLCVSQFALSTTGSSIMKGLESVIKTLSDNTIQGELWVDGSFVTEKIDPADVDVILRVRSEFVESCTDTQFQVLNWFETDDLRQLYNCDCYILTQYPQDHPEYWFGEQMYAYWMRQWGFDRSGSMKGIAVIKL